MIYYQHNEMYKTWPLTVFLYILEFQITCGIMEVISENTRVFNHLIYKLSDKFTDLLST